MEDYANSSKKNSIKNEHKHKLELVPSDPSESVWECTVKGCDFRHSEPEDSGTGA